MISENEFELFKSRCTIENDKIFVISVLKMLKGLFAKHIRWRAMSIYTRTHWLFDWINTPRTRQSGRHVADDIFKYIFFCESYCILIE